MTPADHPRGPVPWGEGAAYTHNGDEALLSALGLATDGFGRDWTDLGTVVVEAEEGQRPAATVRVEVMALPAQAWRFTVTRPRDEIEELGDGRWRSVFEPVHVTVFSTGSGGFGEYWPTAKLIAGNMLVFEAAPMSAETEAELRLAGWYQTEDGLWTADGVPVPMNLSGARIVLAGMQRGAPADPGHEALYWRTGRKVGRTIYAVVTGEVASDRDTLIGVMDTRALAAQAVLGHNIQVHAQAFLHCAREAFPEGDS